MLNFVRANSNALEIILRKTGAGGVFFFGGEGMPTMHHAPWAPPLDPGPQGRTEASCIVSYCVSQVNPRPPEDFFFVTRPPKGEGWVVPPPPWIVSTERLIPLYICYTSV